MREYFRQERLSFRYLPVFWLTRLLFVVMSILLPTAQMFLMITAAVFSYGFRYQTEEESLLPLTDEEIKRMRLARCNMIWLRYLIVGLASILLGYLFPDSIILRGGLFESPVILGAFFTLQMVAVYETLLEKAAGITGGKKIYTPFRYVFCSFPSVILFAYAFTGLTFQKRPAFFMNGAAWIHASILLAATALLAIYCVRLCGEWKIRDFAPNAVKEAKAAKKEKESQ